MFNKYDKVKTFFSCVIFSYVIFRYNRYGIYYNYLDIGMVYIMILMLWYLKMCYRSFIMRISRLKNFSGRELLEYCYYCNSRNERKIYVRACKESENDTITDTNWYELDYLLCLDKSCTEYEYNKFAKNNDTVNKLYDTMMCNYELHRLEHNRMKSDYNCFRYLSLCGIIFCFLVHMLIIFNI